MKTIKFDFYNANKELWLQNFCQAFSLNQKDVREFFRNSIDSDITPNNIVSIFNPNLKHYDSSSIEIVCRHMTTTNDIEISNFKKVGLLDLRNVLRINSPLSQYQAPKGSINPLQSPQPDHFSLPLPCPSLPDTSSHQTHSWG